MNFNITCKNADVIGFWGLEIFRCSFGGQPGLRKFTEQTTKPVGQVGRFWQIQKMGRKKGSLKEVSVGNVVVIICKFIIVSIQWFFCGFFFCGMFLRGVILLVFCLVSHEWLPFGRGVVLSHSMHATGRFTYVHVYCKNQPNVGKYTIHGAFGYCFC